MKKIFLLLFTTLITFNTFADPAENFKQDSLAIGGSISFNENMGYMFSDYAGNTSFHISVNPHFSRFVEDNLSFDIAPHFSYEKEQGSFIVRHNHIGPNALDEMSSMSFGLNLGTTYYFTGLGDIVPAIGLSGGLIYEKALLEDKSTLLHNTLIPELNFLYFINNRLALSVGGNLLFQYSSFLTDYYGDKVSEDDNRDLIDGTSVKVNMNIGFVYYIPKAHRLSL